MNKKNIIKWAVFIIVLMLATIIGWEQVDGRLADWYEGETITYIKQDVVPTTVEGIIDAKARSWLKGPEAYEYAKEQVTKQLIDELGKL